MRDVCSSFNTRKKSEAGLTLGSASRIGLSVVGINRCTSLLLSRTSIAFSHLFQLRQYFAPAHPFKEA